MSTFDETYNDILARASFHFGMTDKQRKKSAFAATAFRWGIPIFSAIVTAVISGKLDIGKINLKEYEIWFGLALTIFTLANSIIRPADIFKSSVKFANQFWQFITSFKLGYKKLIALSLGDKEVGDYLEQKNKELANLISEFNNAFVPVHNSDNKTTL